MIIQVGKWNGDHAAGINAKQFIRLAIEFQHADHALPGRALLIVTDKIKHKMLETRLISIFRIKPHFNS
jgi:hypothetical protein